MECLLYIFNQLIDQGVWPELFKKAQSVIIPKPGKPDYSIPKAYRPIALLLVMGKLCEKMIAQRIQFDSIKHNIFHPTQFGGIQQRSTVDAGTYLVHTVRTNWKKNRDTLVLCFDIVQFFPLVNHAALEAIMAKQGFNSKLTKWMCVFLGNRSTTFKWSEFKSGEYQALIGTPQGAGLSLSFSGLLIAPVIHELFPLETTKAPDSQEDYIFFIDDGLLIILYKKTICDNQKAVRQNVLSLGYMYKNKIKPGFAQVGIVVEDDKNELFHFTNIRTPVNKLLACDLGHAPFIGDTPLKQKKDHFRYLGFFFDQGLTFRKHMNLYANKALGKVLSLGMLGNAQRGLDIVNRRLLYTACVRPVMTYGCKLWMSNNASNIEKIRTLQVAQNAAARWITGCFCTTSTHSLNAIAGVIPMKFWLKQLYEGLLLQNASLPSNHPIKRMLFSMNTHATKSIIPSARLTRRDAAIRIVPKRRRVQNNCHLPNHRHAVKGLPNQ